MNKQRTFVLLALAFLPACASESRLLSPAESSDPPALNWGTASPDGVRMTLRHVIGRSGPGSWVRDADWDEYVVVLGNDGDEPVTVQEVELSSASLANCRHTTDLEALESESRRNLDTLKSIGVAVTVGTTAMAGAFMVAGAATASALSAIMGGGGAAAGAGALMTVMPLVGVIGLGHYAYTGPHARRSGDRAAAAYEMQRSGLRLPATLGPAAELRGSAFFAITPAPTRLHVRYQRRGEARELSLDLEALSALHLTRGTR